MERVRAESVRDEAQVLRESEQRIRTQADKTAREIISLPSSVLPQIRLRDHGYYRPHSLG